jgi:hypothetical protein
LARELTGKGNERKVILNSEPVNAYNFSKGSRLMISVLDIFNSIDKIPLFGF